MSAKSEANQLPQFDVIVLHGVWSWINDDSRRHILNIIRRNLKTGGIVYVSYNALPGWATLMPVRDLMHMLGNAAPKGQSHQRAQLAYSTVHALVQGEAGYFSTNPLATQHIKNMEGQDLNYVVHEYMVQHMRPFYFADVARAMDMAKCSFITSSRLFSQLGIFLPQTLRQQLDMVSDPTLRETLRDFCLNTRFRADIFVKGHHPLTPRERTTRMGKLTLALSCPLETVNLDVPTPFGQVSLKDNIYAPVLAAMADNNYSPKTMEALEDHPLLLKMESSVLEESVAILLAAGYVRPARKAETKEVEQCAKLNAELCRRARLGETVSCLASPVLGSAVVVSRVEQLFLLSHAEGADDTTHMAQDAWNVLSSRGEKLMEGDRELSPEETMEKMHNAACHFMEARWPHLKAMLCLPQPTHNTQE